MHLLRKYIAFIFISTLISLLLFVIADFFDNPVSDVMGYLEIGVFCFVVMIANFFLIGAMASYRWLFAVLFPIYSIIGSSLAYFRISSSAVITPMLVDVILHHDTHEGLELITWQLVCFVLVATIFAALAVWYRFKQIKLNHNWVYLLTCLVLMTGYLHCNSRIHRGCINRYPFNVYNAVKEYVEGYHPATDRVNPFCNQVFAERSDSLVVVLVLGEALRSDHIGLNGYTRNTTPYLSKEKNIITFPNIYSEYTYTNRSLPHILTRADSVNEDLAFTESSFVPAFKKNGFKTIWISNQELTHTYADFIQECDSSFFIHPEKSPYVYSSFYDLDMFPFISRRLSNKNERDLIIIHTIGSHWYYNLHFPDSLIVYKPLTNNRNVKFNTIEQIVNSYDNTIIATDCFLSKVVGELKEKNAIMIFLSDHGEALGEQGLYLHAQNSEKVKHPACFVWMSDSYKERYHYMYENAKTNATRRFRTDFLFPSILDAALISTTVSDTTISIFR